jgi:hypothetical protein
MSIFKTSWLVLQTKKLSEKEFLYQVFFLEYWILWVKNRKKVREKPIDTWYLFQCEIITSGKNSIHIIWNIKILALYQSENKSYKDIEQFLRLLWKIQSEIPIGNPHSDIFTIIAFCISENLYAEKILLMHLKVVDILWNLPNLHSDFATEKTLRFIHKYWYKEISRLWEIPKVIQKNLELML